jgi:hypothetical protein
MRHDETLREYTNHYFKNRNTLVGVKDEDVIAYHNKMVTNLKLFEKIREADAHTIADLMAYVASLSTLKTRWCTTSKEKTTTTVAVGRASDLAKSMRLTHPELPPSLKMT